jgi:hypothetical protein
MSPQPQPPCLAVYAAQFSALDVSGTGRLPADSLVDLLSSDTWDLSDVEVSLYYICPPPHTHIWSECVFGTSGGEG